MGGRRCGASPVKDPNPIVRVRSAAEAGTDVAPTVFSHPIERIHMTKPLYTCGAKTVNAPPGNGMPCSNPVSSPDVRCWRHQGMPREPMPGTAVLQRMATAARSPKGLNPRPPITRTARHVLAYITMCEEPNKPFMADLTKLPHHPPYSVQIWMEVRIVYLREKHRLLEEWADVLQKQIEIKQACRELYECGALTDGLKIVA